MGYNGMYPETWKQPQEREGKQAPAGSKSLCESVPVSVGGQTAEAAAPEWGRGKGNCVEM